MKKRFFLLIVSTLFMLSGCTSESLQEQESAVIISKSEESIEDISFDEERPQEHLYDVVEKESYTNGEIEIVLPKDWMGECVVETTDTGIFIYQKASFEVEEESGLLCAIVREENVIDVPESYPIAYSDDSIFYFLLPSDVPCVEDEEICAEYVSMIKTYNEMDDFISIKRNGLHFDANEFVCPMSHTKEIPDEVLINLPPWSLFYARNEIYARHGRKFNSQYLNDYYMDCSWYAPSIEPEDFEESILSEVEKKNIKKIIALETQYKENKQLQDCLLYGQEYSFDLDGDGIGERLCLRYKGKNGLCCDVEMTINGKTVIENEIFGALSTKGYYVTDIDENSPGLEIAVCDFGESGEPATHFYTYNGEINYIGLVYCMNVTKYTLKDNVLTGFGGKIEGEIRADVFYTCFAIAQWKYSYAEKTIKMIEQEMYHMEADGPYELTEDIKIYKNRSTDSELITLKAQNIYFIESDKESWMKVKGEDGVTGYLHKNEDWEIDSVGKLAEDIIMNLRFAG